MMISSKIYSKWMEKTQRQKIKGILKHVKPKGKVLDVGCGPGFLEEYVEAVALDSDPENLEKVKGEKVLADANNMPFKDKAFDTIFCIDTIHKIKNTSEILRVLKNNGLLIVSIFCNKYNYKEKTKWLKNIFKNLKIEKSFLIKTENEWDTVLILKNNFP